MYVQVAGKNLPSLLILAWYSEEALYCNVDVLLRTALAKVFRIPKPKVFYSFAIHVYIYRTDTKVMDIRCSILTRLRWILILTNCIRSYLTWMLKPVRENQRYAQTYVWLQ